MDPDIDNDEYSINENSDNYSDSEYSSDQSYDHIDNDSDHSDSHETDGQPFYDTNNNSIHQVQTNEHEPGTSESVLSNDYATPLGTPYWIPKAPENMIPKVKDTYGSYLEACQFYQNYALEGGFDVRLGSNRKMKGGVYIERWLLCNREGRPSTKDVNTIDISYKKLKRRKDLHRRQCRAHIVFKIVPGTQNYYVHNFVEDHNHPLIPKANMHLSRSRRQLDFTQQTYIYNMSKQNVGASKAHRLMSGVQGGYTSHGGLVVDFKNYARDLNYFIGGSDAQLIVNLMKDRVNYAPNFSFEFRSDDQQLNAMFWADETSKYNYKEFGDVVSFDATFHTNRYNMVFVPFTGIDNHKKCVTFGAGLLSREDTDSYVWLLQSFLKAFGKQPIIVLSDQDPAMKKAIKKVFPLSQHRLCMWHITSKLQMKIPHKVLYETEFRKRFNRLIWNSKIDELEFDSGWDEMIKEFHLEDNKWLHDMFEMRQYWIPAFFRHIPMCGLMRTTSLSESQNWSFQNTFLTGSYLFNFMMTFDSSMERQRHIQNSLDFSTTKSDSKMLSYLPYEPHAAKVYTRRVFYQVQQEIFESEKACFVKNMNVNEDVQLFVVVERWKKFISKEKEIEERHKDVQEFHYNYILKDKDFKVYHDTKQHSLDCSCMHFERVGLLYRHIFCVMKYAGYDKIPDRYILRRWSRDVIPPELLRRRFKNSNLDDNADKIGIDIFSTVDHCVAFLSHDNAKLKEYYEEINKLKDKFCVGNMSQQNGSKKRNFEQVIGVTIPTERQIENPSNIRNKGSGSRGKRLKSKVEMLAKETQKQKRMCNHCKQMSNHDKRNCPLKNTKA